MRQLLIIRNIEILRRIYGIGTIEIPDRYSPGIKLLRDNFPSLEVEVFHENVDKSAGDEKRRRTFNTVPPFNILKPNRHFNTSSTLASLGCSGRATIILENNIEIKKEKIGRISQIVLFKLEP